MNADGTIIQYIQDIVGWGLCLKEICGDSDTRAYIGFTSPEQAIEAFLSEGYSKDDISEVTPVWDMRVEEEIITP